jgi:hypothetical protein
MPKFHSLRSAYPPRTNDEPGSPLPAFNTAGTENAEVIFYRESEVNHPRVVPTSPREQYSQAGPLAPRHTGRLAPSGRAQTGSLMYRAPQGSREQASQPLQPAQTTSLMYRVPQVNSERALEPLQSAEPSQPHSLVTALQLAMEPKTNRLPVLIPAERKRGKEPPVTGVLSPATRRTISRFKMGVVLGALIAFTFLTAFSFGPVNQGKPLIPLFGNGIQQSQWQGLNSALSLSQQGTPVNKQQPVAAAPAMQNVPQNDLVALAQQDAIKYGISPYYFVRQINAESGFNPNAYSPAGAVGIAQFIPSTAASLGINPYDPVSALDGAARYMAGLSNQFGGDYAKALAAYNAGAGAVQNAVNSAGANWLALMPYETQLYVNRIMG